jgi:hypothetical protein
MAEATKPTGCVFVKKANVQARRRKAEEKEEGGNSFMCSISFFLFR